MFVGPQAHSVCSKTHPRVDDAPSLSLGTRAMQDLAAGYTSGKLLLKLDFTSYILQHHTAEHFAFLDDPANSRSRTTFYFTLARLLFVEDTAAKFKAFVAPLQQARPIAPENPLCHRACFSTCHHHSTAGYTICITL